LVPPILNIWIRPTGKGDISRFVGVLHRTKCRS
jgi:hypothetical protein